MRHGRDTYTFAATLMTCWHHHQMNFIAQPSSAWVFEIRAKYVWWWRDTYFYFCYAKEYASGELANLILSNWLAVGDSLRSRLPSDAFILCDASALAQNLTLVLLKRLKYNYLFLPLIYFSSASRTPHKDTTMAVSWLYWLGEVSSSDDNVIEPIFLTWIE